MFAPSSPLPSMLVLWAPSQSEKKLRSPSQVLFVASPVASPSPIPSDWKAALALLLILPAPCLGPTLALIVGRGDLGIVLWAGAKVWMIALPLLWHLFVDKRPLSLSPPTRQGWVVGALTGGLTALVIAAAYVAIGTHWIDPSSVRESLAPTGLTHMPTYLGVAAFWILGNALIEEYVYRWFVFTRARQWMGRTAAILFSAGAFVLHHVLSMANSFPWEVTLLACTGVFIGGILWSVLYTRYKTLWSAYISHAMADIAVFGVGFVLLFA